MRGRWAGDGPPTASAGCQAEAKIKFAKTEKISYLCIRKYIGNFAQLKHNHLINFFAMKKNNYSMTIAKISLTLLFFSFVQQVNGQDIIYKDTMHAEFSVIRHYRDEIDITYNLAERHSFIYTDRATNSVRYFDIPWNIHLYDFEIHNGKVYFCGEVSYSNYNISSEFGVFGWFDIDSVFFLGASYYQCILGVNNLTPGYHDRISKLRRIEVIESDNSIHLIMTGNGLIGSSKANNTKTFGNASVIVEVWKKAFGTWKMNYTMDYSRKIRYSDVAITRNYVVICASYENGTNGMHTILSYEWPPALSTGQSILYYASAGTNPYSQTLYLTSLSIMSQPSGVLTSIYQTPLIVDLGESDKFATVSCNLTSGNLTHTVSIYNSPLLNPTRRFFFNHTDSSMYVDFAYNPYMQSLYWIPGYSRHMYRTTSPFNNVNIDIPNSMLNLSIDNIPGSQYNIVSGSVDEIWEYTLWRYDETTTGCDSFLKEDTYNLSLEQKTERIDQYIYEYDFQITPQKPQIGIDHLIVICDN